MALVTLTVLQAQAAQALINTALDALARYEMVKDLTDEQCRVLIDEAIIRKTKLDERLANH